MSEANRKLVLTFDVELWNEGEWLKPFITSDMYQIDTFPDSMKNILELLEKYCGHGTFFTTLEVIEKYPQIIQDISSKGHEIGIHGPKHKKLKDYPREEFKNDCITQIQRIEKITGKKPLGYRAPHFSLNKETDWILPILKELGIKYDSSIFPINLGEYGVSRAPTVQYEIIAGLQEVPITVAEFGNIRIPFAGGIYFRFLPYFVFRFFLERTLKQKKLPMIYFHPHELDDKTPRITKGPFFKRYMKYFGVKNSLEKFERIIKNYKCTSVEKTFLE